MTGDRAPSSEVETRSRAAAGRVLPVGEVSLLFSDIEGSTRLLDRLGDAYGDVLAEHRRLLREVWAAHGGVEVDTEGDAFFVAFPVAGEAITAAAQAQRLIEATAELQGLRVRIAVHTGVPKVRDGDYWGADVHYAARLCSAAHGGQVLLSASTRGLVDVGVEDLGEHALKDFPAPRRIFHLLIDGRGSDAFAPIRSLQTGLTNLPDRLTAFIGRKAEVATLRELVVGSRIVSLVGAGGVGKTRLAVELGSELLDGSGDGVWLVELAPLIDPGLVGSTVAKVLGVAEQPGRPVLDAVAAAVGDRAMLVILDNCEHVIDAAAELVRALVARCRGLIVVATSRQPLRVAGERVYRVPSLGMPSVDADLDQIALSPAVQLFVERARDQRPEFGVDADNAPAVARICRRLDGIALAIELAAVRLRSLSVGQLESRLDQRFRLLRTSSRDGTLPRQQTMEALIDWSYQLLEAPEREVLIRTSVFAASGFDLEAAEAVCVSDTVADWEVLDCLDGLIDKSLVVAEDTGGEVRYRLLESVREYSAGKLRETGAQMVMQVGAAHRDYYLTFAETARPLLRGPGAPLQLSRLEGEHDNLRLALTFSLDDPMPLPGLRLAEAMGRFWRMRGHDEEGARQLSAQLDRSDAGAPTIERGRALITRSHMLGERLGNVRGAQTDVEEAVSISRQLHDVPLEADALSMLAFAFLLQGELAEALEIGERAVSLARSVDDPMPLENAMNMLANARLNLGQDARAELAELVAFARARGDTASVAIWLNNLAAAEISRGDAISARAHCEEALQIARNLRNPAVTAGLQTQLGFVCVIEAKASDAGRLFCDALDAFEELGHPLGVGLAVLGVALATPAPATAVQLHGGASAMLRGLGYELQVPENALQADSLSRLRRALGDREYETAFQAGVRLSRDEAVALARSVASTAAIGSDSLAPPAGG